MLPNGSRIIVAMLAAWSLGAGGFLAAADRQWTLETADTRVTVAVANDQPVVLGLQSMGTPHNWAGHPMPVPLMAKVWIGPQEVPIRWTFRSGRLDKSAGTLTLGFTNAEPALALRSIWRARPGHGPVQHWLEIDNLSAKTVTLAHQESLSLQGVLPGGAAQVWWIKRGGSNASTQGGTHTEPLAGSLNLVLTSNCEDGSSPVPWLAVQVGTERGLYVGWEFSGLGRIEAKASPRGEELELNVGNQREFKTDLNPGERFLVPAAFVGCHTGDVEEGSYSLHRFILEKLRPSAPKGYPDPTLAYNLYIDAGGANAKEADVLQSAQTCHELGFETFVPDAMWFPECGDWRWDPQRFPGGSQPIEQLVHQRGMKLGLWCAWSNGGIAEHPGALSVRGPSGRPDWFNADFKPDWKPGPFYGGQICLGSPSAKEWAIRKTQWLVSHHKLDYLKHDCGPIVTQCNKTEHRHKYGVDASYWAAMGYYEVQEKLHQAFPHVLMENCSGGGHIKDFGVIQRTHYTVTTDTLSNLPDRQSLYDSTYALPPMLLQAYTYERNYPVPGDEPGPFLWRSAMMGAWQIDPTNTRIWTEAERDAAKRAAGIYKEWVRPMLQDVKVHHILPRPDGTNWDGMFYWNSKIQRGMVYLFRPDAPEASQAVKLRGLAARKKYWVWSEDGSLASGLRTGGDLITNGLNVTLQHRYTSDLIYLQESTVGKPTDLASPGAFRLEGAKAASDPFAVSARLNWSASPQARSYRVIVAEAPDLRNPLAELLVMRPSVTLAKLPANRLLHWKVEAIGWGGKRWNDGPGGSFPTPPLQTLPGVAFVSDLPWLKATAGANNPVRRDTNFAGQEISIAGTRYPKGVWTHAFNDATPADVLVALPAGKFESFVATAGVEDVGGPAGTLQFLVLVDGQLSAESPILKLGSVHPFRVDVKGAREVTLRVLNGGDGYTCDHAGWGFARFIESGATDPLPQPARRD